MILIESFIQIARRCSRITLALLLTILLNTHPMHAQDPAHGMAGSKSAEKTEQAIARSLTTLTEGADIIAVGKVGKSVSEWNEDRSRIRTRVTISVDETIKGAAPSSSLTVFVPGGEIDGVGEWYSHSVQFQKEEDVVVFASKDDKGRFVVTNGELGKFSIKKDKISGVKIIPNMGTLQTFTEQIKHTVKKADLNKSEQ